MAKDKNVKSEPSNEATPADEPQNLNVSGGLDVIIDLNKNNIVQGFIMSEILGSPRALKSRGRRTWNSRF